MRWSSYLEKSAVFQLVYGLFTSVPSVTSSARQEEWRQKEQEEEEEEEEEEEKEEEEKEEEEEEEEEERSVRSGFVYLTQRTSELWIWRWEKGAQRSKVRGHCVVLYQRKLNILEFWTVHFCSLNEFSVFSK